MLLCRCKQLGGLISKPCAAEKEISMKKILITGGTTFVSKYAAKYFVEHGYDVYVVNRNSKPQVKGVTLIESDRHFFGFSLHFLFFVVYVVICISFS